MYVEFSLKFASQAFANFLDSVHDIDSLFLINMRSEWHSSEVAVESDLTMNNVPGLFFCESWKLEHLNIQAAFMWDTEISTLIESNDWVIQIIEGSVGIFTTCIHTDFGIFILATGEDCRFKSVPISICFIFIFVPDVSC